MIAHRIVEALLGEADEVGDFFDRHMPELEYPSPAQVRYDLSIDAENERPANVFQDDPETVQWIMAELRRGNLYAWFSARCTARWTDSEERDYFGLAYLGCCSYKSREDFMEPGGYWDDMKSEAYDELIKQVRKRREEDYKFKTSDNAVLKRYSARARPRGADDQDV